MFRSKSAQKTTTFQAKRVAALVGSIALVASGLVAGITSPANAVAAPVVKSFDYTVKLVTPGSSVNITSAVYERIVFQAQFNYDDVTSLRGHVITVDSVETGFTEANRPINYALFSFKDANNADVGTGAQINGVSSGQPLNDYNSITVPAGAVKMDINWTTAANISDSYDSGPVAAGTYSSTPKILDRGTVASPTSPTEIVYTSDDVSTEGLYYDHERNYAIIKGIATNFNLPATGNIMRASATAVGCIDWSKVSSSTVATADFAVNGLTPDYFNVSTSDSVLPYSGNPVSGSTLDFRTGSLATWRSESKPIYVFATAEESDSSIVGNGKDLDASLDVADSNNMSILKDCTPPAPTGTGILGNGPMAGQLQYAPTTFTPPSGEWACNLYKKSDDTLVTTGSGWGNMPCMFSGYGPSGPVIPTGVPLYAKPVASVRILGQSLSAEGATTSNDFTMTSDGSDTPPPPPGLFPIGGASVNGKFTVGTKITVTAPKWSLTAGGAPVTTTNRVVWFVCDAPLATSTTISRNIPCFVPNSPPPAQVLANGTSVGVTNGPNQSFTGSSLTITQGLITAMTGKHLMVIVSGNAGTAPPIKRGNVFMKSCGPITSGSTCSSTFGTPVVTPPAKKNPKLPTVAKSVKVKKSVTVKLHASKGTSAKGANSDGLATVVSVAPASKAFCSVTKVVNKKTKKITGYTVKGLKAGKCSIVTTVTGNTTFNSLTRTTTVTVAKNAPKIPTVANKVKVKKSFTVKLHATKGTSAKGANSDGLVTVVSVAPASKAFCSVTKVVNKKTKKITGYTVKGLKAGKCSIVTTVTGNTTFNTLKKTTVVKVSK